MKDSLVVAVGLVIAVFLTGPGQTYVNKCDDATIAAIKADSGIKTSQIIGQLRGPSDDVVAATANYFDAMLSGMEGTFQCSHSVWDLSDDKFTAVVELNNPKKERDGLAMKFNGLRIEDEGLTFDSCDGCPEIVKTAKAYRFFEKEGVFGVYTCNTKSDAATGDKEGFIKMKSLMKFGPDKNNPRTPSAETKQLISEAKEKAKGLGLVINDIQFDCTLGRPAKPKPATPSPAAPAAPAAPAPKKPWMCKFGIILIIIAVVTTAAVVYTSSR